MQRVLAIFSSFVLLVAMVISASAASVSRTYTYFPIGGMTLSEIEGQLLARGPQLNGSGQRHPGATSMEFTTQVDYVDRGGYCGVADARVSVKARVILPRWRNRQRAQTDVRLIWDTLARDIKRHEESHIVIAKNHARMLEDALKNLPRQRSCAALAARIDKVSSGVLASHDAAQQNFDRIESINFERRMLRLLRYRLEQIEAGRLSP